MIIIQILTLSVPVSFRPTHSNASEEGEKKARVRPCQGKPGNSSIDARQVLQWHIWISEL